MRFEKRLAKVLFILIAVIVFFILFCPEDLYPEETVWSYQDSTWVSHKLGESGVIQTDQDILLAIKNWLAENPEYEVREISSSADSVLWDKEDRFLDVQSLDKANYFAYYTDTVMLKIDTLSMYEKIDPQKVRIKTVKTSEDSLKSLALDGGEIVVRSREVARILGFQPLKFGYLPSNDRKTLIVIGKKDRRIENLSERVSDHKIGIELLYVRVEDLEAQNLENQKIVDWSVVLGWSGLAFDNQRDLAGTTLGLKLKRNSNIFSVTGLYDPISQNGHYDVGVMAGVGYCFLEKEKYSIGYEIGGLGGWELNPENSAMMEIKGAMLSGVVELKLGNIAIEAKASFVFAKVWDIYKTENCSGGMFSIGIQL